MNRARDLTDTAQGGCCDCDEPPMVAQGRMQRRTPLSFKGRNLLLVTIVLLALQSVTASATLSTPKATRLKPWASIPTHRRSFVTTRQHSAAAAAIQLSVAVVGSLRGGASHEVDVDEEAEAEADEDEDESDPAASSKEPPLLQQVSESESFSEATQDRDTEDYEEDDEVVPEVVADPEMEEEDASPLTMTSESSSPETISVVETTTTTVLEDAMQPDESESVVTVVAGEDTSEYDNVEEDVDVEETETTEQPEQQEEIPPEEILEQASVLRLAGKDLHDEGNFDEAAVSFCAAANLLTPLLSLSLPDEDDLTEEFATCRLHEALCRLKAEQYEEAANACSDVLGLQGDSVAPALRARAFHRRAKAQLELGNTADALQDARSASFLGDRKAVALYGKLMRDGSPSGSSHSSASSLMNSMSSSDSDNSMAASSALLESLLNKSSGSPPSSLGGSAGDSSGGLPFSPMSLLNMGMGQSSGGEGNGNLAKSVLLQLSKKIEDENTQETICGYLQGTSGPQLQQMAGMAGMQLQPGQAAKLASFCNSVTPKMIRRTVKTTKRGIYVVQLIRKTLRLIAKYRNVLVLLVLLAWIKSAILRPMPVNKRAARRALKEAAKLAAAAM